MDTGELIYLKLRPLKSNLLNQEVKKSQSVVHQIIASLDLLSISLNLM